MKQQSKGSDQTDWRYQTNGQHQPDWQYQRIQRHLTESAIVKQQTVEHCMAAILAAVDLIIQAFTSDKKLLICGNGGSAADCQHLAAEFTNRLSADFERPALPAIALTTDTSFLTAHTNDYDFASVFARQIEALGRPGDVLVCISTSGSSANIIQAIETAHANQMRTIALTGELGHLMKLADVVIAVPSNKTHYIQETHLAIEHLLCDLVEQSLFGHNGPRM